MWQRLNENKDLIIVAIASFFIGFGSASFFGGNTTSKDKTESLKGAEIEDITLSPLPFNKETNGEDVRDVAGAKVAPRSNMLVVENQRAGSSVMVKKAELSAAQWIVVREKNKDGSRGSILGAGWFPAGVHENISVSLARETVGGEEYLVIIFADINQDKQFDHKVDEPVKDAGGNIISISFNTVASPSNP